MIFFYERFSSNLTIFYLGFNFLFTSNFIYLVWFGQTGFTTA